MIPERPDSPGPRHTRASGRVRIAVVMLLRVLPPAALVIWVVYSKTWVPFFWHLASVSLLPVAAALVINFVGFMSLRALRWRTAMPHPPPFTAIYASMIEGITANIAVGGGIGDFVRSARLGRDNGFQGFSRTFGTSAADRLSEYLALTFLMAVVACTGLLAWFWALVAPVACLGVSLVMWRGTRLARLLNRWPKALAAAESFLQALSPKRLFTMTGLAFAAWAVETVMVMLVLLGFGLPSGAGTAALVVVCINVAVAIPGPPANVGTFEAGVVFALTTMGTTSQTALSFAVFYHAFHVLPVVLLGALLWTVRGRKGSRPT